LTLELVQGMQMAANLYNGMTTTMQLCIH